MIRIVVATLCAFGLGWCLGLSANDPPAVPVEQLHPESTLSLPPAAVIAEEHVREVITRTPVTCAECEAKDSAIHLLRQEKTALETQLSQACQALANAQMQLEWRPFLQELQQSLHDWHPDEIQSVFARSKLFPQVADLYTAQGLVRSGQLTPADLLEIAQEASRIEAEKLKAIALEDEQRVKQLATFESLAHGFISKLQRRGFSLFAENFRAGVGLN